MSNEKFEVGEELVVVDEDSLLYGRVVTVVAASAYTDGSAYYVCRFRRLNADGTEAEAYGSGMFEPEMLARNISGPRPVSPGRRYAAASSSG